MNFRNSRQTRLLHWLLKCCNKTHLWSVFLADILCHWLRTISGYSLWHENFWHYKLLRIFPQSAKRDKRRNVLLNENTKEISYSNSNEWPRMWVRFPFISYRSGAHMKYPLTESSMAVVPITINRYLCYDFKSVLTLLVFFILHNSLIYCMDILRFWIQADFTNRLNIFKH